MHFTKQITKFLFLICLFTLFSATSLKAEILVKGIKFTKQNDIEITISTKTKYKSFTLNNPSRLVVDVTNGKLAFNKNSKFPSFVKKVRTKEDANNLRIVFDLSKKVSLDSVKYSKVNNISKIILKISGVKIDKIYQTSSLAKSSNSDSKTKERKEINLSGDFIFDKVMQFEESQKPKISKKEIKITKDKKSHNAQSQYVKNKNNDKKIIVIDSGHGGKDPGTIGLYARTKEKNITLSYAKELARQLNRTKKYKVYLTRANDRFIPLRGRVAIARRKKADLFISLHANSTKNRKTKGFSIYTLSEKSSDKQAERLARKENRADIIHGMNFSRTSPDIVKTLIALSQREAKNSSAIFAKYVIKSIRRSGITILQNTHRFAGFAVLTAPDMASVLIELGYLTNKKEERLLNSTYYKKKLSKSLVKAIDEYFSKIK